MYESNNTFDPYDWYKDNLDPVFQNTRTDEVGRDYQNLILGLNKWHKITTSPRWNDEFQMTDSCNT